MYIGVIDISESIKHTLRINPISPITLFPLCHHPIFKDLCATKGFLYSNFFYNNKTPLECILWRLWVPEFISVDKFKFMHNLNYSVSLFAPATKVFNCRKLNFRCNAQLYISLYISWRLTTYDEDLYGCHFSALTHVALHIRCILRRRTRVQRVEDNGERVGGCHIDLFGGIGHLYVYIHIYMCVYKNSSVTSHTPFAAAHPLGQVNYIRQKYIHIFYGLAYPKKVFRLSTVFTNMTHTCTRQSNCLGIVAHLLDRVKCSFRSASCQSRA